MGEYKYSVNLSRIVEEFNLEKVNYKGEFDDLKITSSSINRAGLNLDGYFEFFDNRRIQIFGITECGYMKTFSEKELERKVAEYFDQGFPACVFTSDLEIPEIFIKQAEIHDIPLLRTSELSSNFTSALIAFLNLELAPRITRHGVLIEVYGEGILLLGESGVGKSETAIELVKRGHRLIADDAVEIKRVSAKSLVGSAPKNIRHFVELRGIGIINARRIFGMGAVKVSEKIDMVIRLEPWDNNKSYDRMGLENEVLDILGIKIPSLEIPVKPGRNLAIIIEVAAMNNRQKKMGYNAATELLNSLGLENDGTF